MPPETIRTGQLGRDVKVAEAICWIDGKVQPEIFAVHLQAGHPQTFDCWRFCHIAQMLMPGRSCCVGLHAACRCRESRAPQRNELSAEQHHGSLSLYARL